MSLKGLEEKVEKLGQVMGTAGVSGSAEVGETGEVRWRSGILWERWVR